VSGQKRDPQSEHILITGATGALGPAVVETFCEAYRYVRAVARHRPPAGLLPDAVEFVEGDIVQPSFCDSVMEDVTVVLHLAGRTPLADPARERRDEYERANVSGTRSIVESAVRSGVRRVVFFSTVSVYGASGGRVFDESCAPAPAGIYAETKLQAEDAVRNARRPDGAPLGCILRLAAVYGPHTRGNYRTLVRALARRRFIPVGDGGNRRALIYDKDAAQAALIAALHPAAAGSLFNLSDGRNHTMNEIVEAICRALGRRPPRLRLPPGPVRTGIAVIERAASLLGLRPPVTGRMLETYLQDIAVDSRSIRERLGFAPRFDLTRGWEETVAAMRRGGLL